MKGYDIYNRALTLLGYGGNNASPAGAVLMEKRCLEAINQISADLKCEPISSLAEELPTGSAKTEALCCGVAMIMSLTESDGEKNRIFADLYNAKRAAALAKIEHIGERLPDAGTEQAV